MRVADFPLDELRKVARDEAVCYRLPSFVKLQLFRDGFYKLVPTAGAPTIEISGVRMHRTKETTPWPDTFAKLAAIRPVTGRVLDTTTGLGYTAILAAQTAECVLTIERDPGVIAIAEQNPWSHELFEPLRDPRGNPKIERRIGDSAEIVPTLPDCFFDRVVHDPPTLALAGELYGLAFYRELRRVLRPGGRLFHYTGAPGRRRGLDLAAGVARRLREAGFSRVRPRPEALGVSAAVA